jgi:ABC-type branched-subunit amino acid transport system substrate-binding protein
MTLAALSSYLEDDMVGVAVTWWSGWEFEDNILQSGYNYCVESMNAVDYAIEVHGVESVMAVHFPGDYGEDSAVGAEIAAEVTGLDFVGAVETLPNAVVGDQSAPIGAIVRAEPDLVIVATSAPEFAEIVGGAVAQGFEGRFIGSVPTVNPGLLATPAGPALMAQSEIMAPWGTWGSDTDAHRAMQEQFGEGAPPNDGYTFGWVWSYPMKSLLEQAVANGDLTRQGLLEAVEQMTVDYEGALPDKSYAGDPNETLVRDALVIQWDEDAPLGTSVLREFEVTPTAAEFDLVEPCTDPRTSPMSSQ